MTRAAIPTAVADGLAAAGPLSAVVEARVPADADPHAVVRELHELRGLLAREEERRDALNEDLMTLQLQLSRRSSTRRCFASGATALGRHRRRRVWARG